MSSPFTDYDPLKLLDNAMRWRKAEQARADRRRCDDEGHPSYQVTGRRSPTRVTCPRCRCTWAIGPKTEPTS